MDGVRIDAAINPDTVQMLNNLKKGLRGDGVLVHDDNHHYHDYHDDNDDEEISDPGGGGGGIGLRANQNKSTCPISEARNIKALALSNETTGAPRRKAP